MDKDQKMVRKWMSTLIKEIGMKELAAPRSRYCPVPGNRGLTADAIIETSHVALHSWDECVPAVLQFDLYTCSELSVDQVIASLQVFEPSKIEFKFLDRESALILVSESTMVKSKLTLGQRLDRFLDRIFKLFG